MKDRTEKEVIIRRERGFSLIEVIIAMAITLVIIGAALGVFKSLTDAQTAATQVSEISQDIQTSLNLIRRDLQKVGSIPEFGIPLPADSGWGANRWCDTAVSNCSSQPSEILLLASYSNLNRGFGIPGGFVFDPVTPGSVNNGDAMSILFEDDFARNIEVIVQDATSFRPQVSGDAKFSTIRRGDFIFLQNNAGESILQRVSTVEPGVIKLETSDPTGINSSLAVFNKGGGFPINDINASILRRVTYYLDTDDDNVTWLMRQVNVRRAVRLVPGIQNFNITYEIGAGGSLAVRTLDEFSLNPLQVMNIRKVTVDIQCDSETQVVGGNTVTSAQRAEIAVRRYNNIFNTQQVNGVTISCLNNSSTRANLCLNVRPDTANYTVYLSAANTDGSYNKTTNVSYTTGQGINISGLTNNRTYYAYVVYMNGSTVEISDKILLSPCSSGNCSGNW